ncbi:MAG: beta strand repeat-containing protein [Planctomycetales bacterium]
MTLLTGGTIRDLIGIPDLIVAAGDTATLNGTVAPGRFGGGAPGEPGILGVTGSVSLADNTTYEVQIGGTAPGDGNGNHDQIDASGSVTIGTNVTLSIAAFFDGDGGLVNFVPSQGDSFEIINRTGGAGTFSGLAEGAIISNFLGTTLRAHISYAGGDGDDVVISILPPDVNVNAGALVVNNEAGDINTYIITLIGGGATVQIQDTTSLIFAGTGATQVGPNTVTVPAASVTAGITFNGRAAADSLEVNRTGGDPTLGLGLTWNGGDPAAADGDILTFSNGTVTTTTVNYTDANSGNVNVDGIVHTFTELEDRAAASGITSSLASSNVVLNYSTSAETIAVSDTGGTSTTVDSAASASTTFINPTTQLTTNAGDTGDDIINVTSLAASYPAAISIDGQGGTDTVNINSAVSTNGNDITLAAEAVTTTATVAAGAGSIAITADAVVIGAAVSGTGTLTIAPQTTTATIGLGGGAGTLNLDDAELAFLTDSFSAITIGDTAAGTGTVTIDTATFSDPVTIAGGIINDATGADIVAGTNAVTLQGTVAPGAAGGAASGILNVTGNLTLAANDTFAVEIGGTSPGELATTHDQINVTGTVTIGANVTLTTSVIGAFVPFAGDEFVIINNDGADAVSGTFLGLAEGAKIANFLGSGRSGTVSYVGGDGNDVTITGDGFFVSIDGAGNLVLTDNAGTADAVTIQADPATSEYVITHTTELIGNQVAPFTGTGTMVVRVPFAAVTGTEIIANFDGGDDSLTVDYSLGEPFGKSITLNGGEAGETNGDKLFITGDAGTTVASGVYTPGTTAEAGQHVLTLSAGAGGGTETISFTQVELANQVSAIPSYTLTTGGSNDVLSADADTVGAIPAATITGTTDLVPITPITFFDVASFTVDTGTNDTFGGGQGNDSVTINSGLDDGVDLARNLTNFSIDTGSAGTGNTDSAITNAVIDVPGSVSINNAETVDLNVDIETGTSLTISNVASEIDLAQDVDLTAENGDLSLNTNVTLIDLSGAAGTNNLIANDTDASGDGNVSVGPISDSGTPAALVIDGDNAVTTSTITVQSTVAILANQDGTGAETLTAGGDIVTTNDTATAVSITVNAGGGGTGNASLGVITAGTTSGAAGGRVTVNANAGAITDGNGAANNLTAGNAILIATAGVGTAADPIETIISRLEGAGGTGGVFVTDVDSLTIGGIDAGTTGVSSGTGNIDGRTSSGTLTVEENVTSTTSGNILLKTTDTAGVGEDLTVNAGVTISTNTGNIDIQAGDNPTLAATSHLNAPGGTIAITGDSGDADAGVGSTLTIAAELDSTGTAINGGGDDDIYDFFYPAGATNSGTATIADTGGTDEVMIHGTAAAEELFLTTSDPPTTATTEQVTRATATAEPVIIPSDIEAVTLLGGDGNDIFHVQPSMLFPITVNGDNPSFGDAGVPLGDQLDLDTFGNSFTINGKTIFVANGTPDPYQGITFLNIETVPLSPASAGPDQSFDFDDPTNSGPIKTQAGFISVNPDTIFTTGNFGWQRAMGGFETGTNTGVAANFINDGHTFAPTSGADTNTFSATVGNGWVMATIAFGSDYHAIVGMQIENADDNTVIASNLSAATRETDHVTVLVLVQDGTLDLRFRDPERETNTFRRVSIKGIDLETDGGTGTLGFLSMGFPTPGTLAADGTTIDTFPLSAAEPNSLVTVATTLGTLSGTDADPNIEGFQVLTDGSGEASILIRRSSAAGQALVDLSSVTGRKTGCIVIDYGQVAGRNFDFNTNVSATFSPFDATTNPDGYIGVVVDDLFTAERGYGWTTTAPDNFQVTPSIGGSMPELVDDGHIASDARTFRTTLANGTYQVHVTMGAYADHQSKSISANGVLVLDAQTIVNRTLFETIFTVTVTSGQLDLTFSQNDDVFGSNHWIINALEIRPTASVVAITPPANVGDVDAQRTNLTVANTLSFATTAPDGTLMTVSSTLGTITTADADPTTAGTQVAVAGGMVTFDLLPGNKAGTPTVEIHSLDGEHRATVNDAAFLNYVIPVTRRFDFNNGTSDPASQSASASGFVGVSLRDQSPATNGFGFNENRMSGVFQSGDIPGVTNDDFYRDGIRREVQGENGRGLTNASFSIEARAGIDYDVRVYLGAPNLNFMNFSVAVEGAGTQTVGTLILGNFTSLTFPMANDEDGDGFIKISFLDEVAPYDGFGIPGIDIAESATGLPAVAPLLAAEFAAGSPVVAANPTTINNSDLTTAVDVATIAFLNSGLSTSQRATLQNISLTVADLAPGVLGLADGAVITIDDDGAGAGWSRSLTDVANDQYDLLTVVSHEIGHALGFADSDPVSDFQDLMNGELTVGVRHDSLGNIDDFFGAAIFDVTGIGSGPVDPVSRSNAIIVSLNDSGDLLITDTSDAGLNQTLTLATADGVLTISDPGNSFMADAGTLMSVHQVQVPLSEITSLRVVVDLQNGADILDASAVQAGLSLNVTGGTGNDMITGGNGDDTIDGGAGNDELAGGGGTDTLLVNSESNVTLTESQSLGAGVDAHDGFERAVISGGASNDRLDASQAGMPVTLFGNDGDDTLLGSSGDDILDGGAGHDVAEFVGSNITLTSNAVMGAGDDALTSVEGLQLIADGNGSTIDASAYSAGSVTIVGSSGDDTLTGGAGDDIIIAGSGNDVVSGGDGNDLILGGSGNDNLSGGAGNDTINGGHGRDAIDGGTDDDALRGGPQADTLKGGGGNDDLQGDAGADVLEGEAGSDSLAGGAGANSLIGGTGDDVLNSIAVPDDFNATVGTDHLIGGNAPQARPAPVEAGPVAAAFTIQPPSTSASASNSANDDDESHGSSDGTAANLATLDSAFGDSLITEILEI